MGKRREFPVRVCRLCWLRQRGIWPMRVTGGEARRREVEMRSGRTRKERSSREAGKSAAVREAARLQVHDAVVLQHVNCVKTAFAGKLVSETFEPGLSPATSSATMEGREGGAGRRARRRRRTLVHVHDPPRRDLQPEPEPADDDELIWL